MFSAKKREAVNDLLEMTVLFTKVLYNEKVGIIYSILIAILNTLGFVCAGYSSRFHIGISTPICYDSCFILELK